MLDIGTVGQTQYEVLKARSILFDFMGWFISQPHGTEPNQQKHFWTQGILKEVSFEYIKKAMTITEFITRATKKGASTNFTRWWQIGIRFQGIRVGTMSLVGQTCGSGQKKFAQLRVPWLRIKPNPHDLNGYFINQTYGPKAYYWTSNGKK